MRTLFLSFYKHQKAVRNVMIDTNKSVSYTHLTLPTILRV